MRTERKLDRKSGKRWWMEVVEGARKHIDKHNAGSSALTMSPTARTLKASTHQQPRTYHGQRGSQYMLEGTQHRLSQPWLCLVAIPQKPLQSSLVATTPKRHQKGSIPTLDSKIPKSKVGAFLKLSWKELQSKSCKLTGRIRKDENTLQDRRMQWLNQFLKKPQANCDNQRGLPTLSSHHHVRPPTSQFSFLSDSRICSTLFCTSHFPSSASIFALPFPTRFSSASQLLLTPPPIACKLLHTPLSHLFILTIPSSLSVQTKSPSK